MILRKIFLLTFLAACTCNTEKPSVPAPEPSATPLPAKAYAWNSPTRDKILNAAIVANGASLLTVKPNDWRDYISTWPTNREGLIYFWGNIISTMAKYESNWKSATSYKENFKDRHGKYVISRGLLQLSYESGRGYKCEIPDEKALHYDEVNLACGVKILDRWVGRDGVISAKTSAGWRGGARYWSVLRGTSTHTRKALTAIKAINKL